MCIRDSYEPKPYINGQKYDPLLFTVNSSGEGYYCKSPNREFAESLVSEIAKRNPGVITVRKITVDGKNYDCVTQPAEVAALFQMCIRDSPRLGASFQGCG